MKVGRLGFTESTLLFCFYLRTKGKPTLELMSYETNFLKWLFDTSGFYDVSFNYNHSYVETPLYKKLMEEFYKMNKLSTKTMFLIHDNVFSGYLPSFYQEFNTERYDPKETFFNFIRDKKVLFINPMANLMKQQYENGNLQKINNIELNMSVSIYENKYTFFNNGYGPYKNSFEYVDSIMNEINSFDVDCVVISCGAISALIANRLNKDYLLIGSDSLTFFGIKHGRLKTTYNEFWIDVPESYKPPNYKMIEGGCYW